MYYNYSLALERWVALHRRFKTRNKSTAEYIHRSHQNSDAAGGGSREKEKEDEDVGNADA